MSLAHSGGGARRRLKRLPYDINLWRYLLPSVEKSSMRDHYSFSALTEPPPPRRFAAVLAAMAWNLNACTSWPATPYTRRATRAPYSRAPQRHTPASGLSEARRNSVKKKRAAATVSLATAAAAVARTSEALPSPTPGQQAHASAAGWHGVACRRRSSRARRARAVYSVDSEQTLVQQADK